MAEKCQYLDRNNSMTCEYKRYSAIVSCDLKLPILSTTKVSKDKGNIDTSNRAYKKDPRADYCQATSTKTYASTVKGFDVGHMTPIDLFDDDLTHAMETNYLTNLVPQSSSLNRTGAWKRTETLTECYRDDEDLIIMSGVIFGGNTLNDHYATSHGIPKTPDQLWKLVYLEKSKKYDLWIIPNDNSAKANYLAQYRHSINVLITALNNEDKVLYEPVIDHLDNIISKTSSGESGRIKLTYNSNCHARKG